jgi:hypothetical protein
VVTPANTPLTTFCATSTCAEGRGEWATVTGEAGRLPGRRNPRTYRVDVLVEAVAQSLDAHRDFVEVHWLAGLVALDDKPADNARILMVTWHGVKASVVGPRYAGVHNETFAARV